MNMATISTRFCPALRWRSARREVPVVLAATGARERGRFRLRASAWLSVWKAAGLGVFGVDGPYVDQARLLIDGAEFRPADPRGADRSGAAFRSRAKPGNRGTSARAPGHRGFVANLVAHGDRVLFSAAVPGQGGEPPRERAGAGILASAVPHAWIRRGGSGAASGCAMIPMCNAGTRCNSILYVRPEMVASLPEPAAGTRSAGWRSAGGVLAVARPNAARSDTASAILGGRPAFPSEC